MAYPDEPVVNWHTPLTDTSSALIVMLHGRGSDENDLAPIADSFPDRAAVALLRGPIQWGPGWTWFDNEGVGKPQAKSIDDTITFVRTWLDKTWAGPTVVMGFSAGGITSGALALHDPKRFDGLGILSGALPLDSGLPIANGRLEGLHVLQAHGDSDDVIPADMVQKTGAWLVGDSGAIVTQKLYAGLGHGISREELGDLLAWLEPLVA